MAASTLPLPLSGATSGLSSGVRRPSASLRFGDESSVAAASGSANARDLFAIASASFRTQPLSAPYKLSHRNERLPYLSGPPPQLPHLYM
jgi:hypothetical protein